MAKTKNIPIPDNIKQQLEKFGIDKNEIDNETALTVALYKEALGGNVSAIREFNKLVDSDEEPTEKAKDISKEVAQEEKKIKQNLCKLRKDLLDANTDFIHQLAFMSVTLKNLSNDIAKNGVKEKYKNGANQWRL